MNWDKYREEIKNNLKWIKDIPLMNRIMRLVDSRFSEKTREEGQPGKRTKIFMKPTVRAAIRKKKQAKE